MTEQIGSHYLIELYDCNPEKLKDASYVENVMMQTTEVAGATYLSHVTHQFKPYGATCLVLVAESHLSIHTWPEKSYAAVDIFSCGKIKATDAIEELSQSFEASGCKVVKQSRINPEG